MRVEVTRDAGGRPVSIRVRMGGADAPTRPGVLGRLRQSRILSPLRKLTRLARSPLDVIRQILPTISIARGDETTIARVQIRVGGTREPWLAPHVDRVRAAVAGVPALFRSVPGGLWAVVPGMALRRDSTGRPEALIIRVGGAAPRALAEEPERPEKPTKWVIEPSQADPMSRVREFWRYRRILWFFAARAVTRMYQGMNLGMAWLFVRPLLPIAITTLVFGRLLNVPSEGVPYFLFFLVGSTAWTLFERSLLWVTRSLDQNKGLIKKVYFPRVIVPITSVVPSLVDAVVYLSLLIAATIYFWFYSGVWYLRLGPGLLLAAVAALLSVVLAIGVGFWTSIWQVRLRETRMTLRYVMRFWNYLTPVLYPLSQVPEKYHWIIFLNPMAPMVETFKWGIIGVGELNWTAFASAVGIIGLTLVSGLWYFTRSEATSIDTM